MMKRIFCLLLAACMMASLCACGKGSEKDAGNDTPSSDVEVSAPTESIPAPNEQETPDEQQTPEEPEQTQTSADGVDVDLTVLSSTMVYSEVYNMLYNDPAHYLGKTVKVRGKFSIYQLVTNGVLQPDPVSYACIISDAAACPDDYPELGAEIIVIGEFQSYEENGMTWYHLVNARLA